MTDLKNKQKHLLLEWKMVLFDLDRKHNSIKNEVEYYQIGDDQITKHRNFVEAYAKTKQEIEKRFNNPEFVPPDDALETAKKELSQQLEQEKEFADYAKLKDKQQSLIHEWKAVLFELDRSHCRTVNQVKFCQMSDDLRAKHEELLLAYEQTKQDIEKRFNDPLYDPPIDALDSAKREIIHQLDREEEFAALAKLKDKQKSLLDEWKIAVSEFDQRHDITMNKPLAMCNYLKKKHEKLSIGYVQAKQVIERRFENPQFHPQDGELETARKVLSDHLEMEEQFVDHVQEPLN